jgi:hypothetical protein
MDKRDHDAILNAYNVAKEQPSVSGYAVIRHLALVNAWRQG